MKDLNADLLRNAYSKTHLTELVKAFNQKLEEFLSAFKQLRNHGVFKTVKINHFDQKIHDIMIDIKKNSISNCHDYIEKHGEKGYMAFKNELEKKLSKLQISHSKYTNFVQQLAAKNTQPKHEKKSLFFSEENSEEFYSKAVTGYPTMFSPF